MAHYHVEWSMDLNADSPEDAARQAFSIMQDPETNATVFDVTEFDSTCEAIRIDLRNHGARRRRGVFQRQKSLGGPLAWQSAGIAIAPGKLSAKVRSDEVLLTNPQSQPVVGCTAKFGRSNSCSELTSAKITR